MALNVLNAFQSEAYIRACVAKAGLKLVWEDSTQPRTEGTTMYLPRIKMNEDNDALTKRKLFVAHECGHHEFTDFTAAETYGRGLLDPSNQLGMLWNLFEDCRVDHLVASEYIGDRQVIDAGMELIQDAQDKTLTKAPLDDEQKQIVNDLAPVMCLDALARNDYFPGFTTAFTNGLKHMEPHYTPETHDRIKKILSEHFIKELEVLKNIEDPVEGTKASLEFAKRIYEEIYEKDADQAQQQANEKYDKQKGSGNGEGEKSEEGKGAESGSDPSEGENGEYKDQAEGNNGEGEEGEPTKRTKDTTVDYSKLRDVIPKNHKGSFEGAGLHINYDKRDMRAYVPHTKDTTVVFDWVNPEYSENLNISTAKRISKGSNINKSFWSIANAGNSEGFANQVRMKLQIRSRSRHQYGVKRGDLHKASLHKVVVRDAPGYNERVFKKKIDSDTLDTCVQLVVDLSGSMSGTKVMHAAYSAYLLQHVLGNTLHIPVEVVGFSTINTDDWNKELHAMHIFRKFAQKKMSEEAFKINFQSCQEYALANNLDGDSILWSYNRILQQKQKRKVMIVLSDGSPAGNTGGTDLYGYTKTVIEAIEKDSRVDIYGIGIMDTNVKDLYKDHCVINNAGELEKAVLSVIDRKVL